MVLEVVATWNDCVVFAGRVREPIRPRDVMRGADGEFAREDDGTLVCGDLRVRAFDVTKRGAFRFRPRLRAALSVLAASFALHAIALGVSRVMPVDLAAESAARRALIARLLSVHVDAREESAPAEGFGARAKGEEGAMGRATATRDAPNEPVAVFGVIGFGAALEVSNDGGRGGGAPRASAPAHVEQATAAPFRAGEWDDNAAFADFRRLVATTREPIQTLDVSVRRVIVARDARGRALPNCAIVATDAQNNTTALRTLSSGRALLFPRAEGLVGDALTVSMRCGGNAARKIVSLVAPDALVTLDGREPRDAPRATIDVAFALDTTGSMAEEIDAVKATLLRVASRVANVRVGLVEYKDHGDEYVTRVFPMSGDLPRFATRIASLSAEGGGDFPEAVNEGVHEAIASLAWNPDAAARLLFVIGDAPPHTDALEPRYADDALRAAHDGIQIFTVAASGMDTYGQLVFRQLAQLTGGTEMFVLRGPTSRGAGDPITSCGGTERRYKSANLDALIVAKIVDARAAIDRDPLARPAQTMSACR